MLENSTKLKEENLVFLNKLRLNTPLIKIYRIVVTLLGILFLVLGLLRFMVSFPHTGMGTFEMLCGILLLVIAFYGLKAYSLNRLRKQSHTDAVRNYTITNAGIRSYSELEGVKAATDYSFDSFGKVYRHGNCIYMEIKLNKMYLLIDMNGFPNPKADAQAFLDCLNRNGIVPVTK